MLNEKWRSVRRQEPCPICGRGDWCQVAVDGKGAICRRIESKHRQKGGGWFHSLNNGGAGATAVRSHTPHPAPPVKRHDLHLLAQKFRTSMTFKRAQLLSRELQLSLASLEQLGVGWCDGEPMLANSGRWVNVHAWSFPMRNAAREVTGLRMRSTNGQKFAFAGGAGGLFIPRDLAGGGRAYLLEGPTDLGAAIDIGMNAFGRESCNAGVPLIVDLLKREKFEELVIFSQRDEAKQRDKRRPELGVFYPAQEGAAALAGVARLYVPKVRIILTPIGVKDVRIWKQQGAVLMDVERLVAAAPLVNLKVKSSIEMNRGRKELA